MDYTELGKTGLNVSRLSFGASALGGVFRDIDEADGIRAGRECRLDRLRIRHATDFHEHGRLHRVG